MKYQKVMLGKKVQGITPESLVHQALDGNGMIEWAEEAGRVKITAQHVLKILFVLLS